MLPDYPTSKAQLHELLTRPLAMAQHAGIFSQMKTRRMFEGHKMGLIREDGSMDITEPRRFTSDIQIDLKEVGSMTTAGIFQKMVEQARDLHSKQSRALFEKMHESIAEAGNVRNLQGAPLTPEVFLEHFKRFQVEFEDDGKPRMPTIVGGPEVVEDFRSILDKIGQDPLLKSKFAEIMDEKKRAWRDRESSRKLVG